MARSSPGAFTNPVSGMLPDRREGNRMTDIAQPLRSRQYRTYSPPSAESPHVAETQTSLPATDLAEPV